MDERTYGRTDGAINKDVPPVLVPLLAARVTCRLFYYTLRKHREYKRTTRTAAERRELSTVRVRDAVCSENALLFQRDKKFNVWIITSDLIDRRGERDDRSGRFPLGY